LGAFEYTALDPRGREKRGVLEGDTARQVRHQLRTQGWTPLEVDEVADAGGRDKTQRTRRTRISAMDLALITRQLATLLRSGLPVEQALQAVAQQSGKARLERIVLAVRARVREGHSLAEGLAQFPNVFPELYVRTVEAGEQSGHLEVVLERLADYTEKRQQMRQKTSLALFYPAMLTAVAVVIVSALLTYVVPKVVQVFDNVAQELPLITRALIAVSDAARAYGLYAVAAVILAIVFVRYSLRKPATRALWDRMLLRLPLIGRVIRGTNTGRFARTLSILTASNVQILEALRISAQVLTNVSMRQAVEQVGLRVREGSSLSGALERTGYFPPMMLSLIASGESSGNLEGMLDRAAEIQEREIETMVATLLALFEPILILVMGAVVLVIVIAILLPIFELNELIA
jgi:general secretion pathway protein F